MEKLPTKLEEINLALKGTPFMVSYRVLNELTIMVGVMLDEGMGLDEAIAASVNNILLMKICHVLKAMRKCSLYQENIRQKLAYRMTIDWNG